LNAASPEIASPIDGVPAAMLEAEPVEAVLDALSVLYSTASPVCRELREA